MRRALLAFLLLAVFFVTPGQAQAATAPSLTSTWATDVFSSSALLWTAVNPNGAATAYHFDYITAAAYQANIDAGKDSFTGAAKVPAPDKTVGSGTGVIKVSGPLSGLTPETPYRYRAVAKNSLGTTTSAALTITTQGFGGASILLDGRGWEMVSPSDKNGGQVDFPETIFGGGVFQAAAQGAQITYSSATSFGPGAGGAPQGSQYVATRTAGGWSNQNITTPMLSGSYGTGPVGAPYQLFSADLARGLMLNGRHCRDGGEGCGVQNPPLAGSEAPAGYQNYYLRQAAGGAFGALIEAGDLAHTTLDAAHFDLVLLGASSDLGHVVLSSCAALTPGAIEVPDGEGCDAESPNLYVWSAGTLSLINSTPGAALAAPSGAISADGSRVYFTQGGDLYLRDGGTTKQVDQGAGGGGTFETASADGSLAYFTKAEHLWRYEAPIDSATDLTSAGEVKGVLGASADGAYVYYTTPNGLFLRHEATTTEVAPGAATADKGNYPPATGMARVSADGTKLAFVSAAPLGEFDNIDQNTGKADAELYLYDATVDVLTCVSCNPSGARPLGPASLPGAYANGFAPGSLQTYKPRAMVLEGRRLFFDSADALVLSDTNGEQDAYEWEAEGTGNCTRPGGCLALLSSGKDSLPASFLDASADGSDAYFLTNRSLVSTDPGSVDLYDARVGGGFPAPFVPIPCKGDACQVLPPEPDDPAVTTLVVGPGNPPLRYPKHGHHHKKHKKQADKKKHKPSHGKGAKR